MPERSLRAATRRWDFVMGAHSASLEHEVRSGHPRACESPLSSDPYTAPGVVVATYYLKDGQLVTEGPGTYKDGNSPVDSLTGSEERTP